MIFTSFYTFVQHFRQIRYAGNAAKSMGETRNMQRILVGNLRGRDHLRDLRVDGRTILKFIKQK
jgi:hypothetical protein